FETLASGSIPALSPDLGYLSAVYGDDVEHDFVVPTVHDHLAEPTESMRLALTDRNAKPLPGTPVLTGTVLDKP
ncbi:hypothetical protein PV359_34615, partial [Streptomyces stelliscabiei]|uniref:hypothetical protein n=1 Tax=Streptomyces stelliscabiei TaxID=146820 RepID=UPI0029B95CEE